MQTKELFAFWKGGATKRMRDDFLMRSIKSRREAAQSATTRASIAFWYQASALPLSVYLRRLILGESIQAAPSEELRRLRAEIHQIGNNINQLARKANAGFASRDEVTRALRMLDRVYELMYGFSK